MTETIKLSKTLRTIPMNNLTNFYAQIDTDGLKVDVPENFVGTLRHTVDRIETYLRWRLEWVENAAILLSAAPTVFTELQALGEFLKMFPATHNEKESSLEVSVDSSINVSAIGPKPFFHMLMAYLIRAGWNPPKLDESNASYYYNTVRRRDKDEVKIYTPAGRLVEPYFTLNMSSTSCRREIVGYKTEETPIFATVCE